MTETTKRVLPSVVARVLPLLGLCAAIVVNAAWIGFLGYWITGDLGIGCCVFDDGGGARSQTVLNYSVLASLRDPISDRVPICRATHQVAALHEAIEGYADIQFANIAPALTGSF